MNTDNKERRKPRRKNSTIRELFTENFLAVQTGIICAVVFFIFGIIFGLKFGKGSPRKSTSGVVAAEYSDAAPSREDVTPSRSYAPDGTGRSGGSSITTWNDLERASDADRQRHYQGVADSANRAGMKHNVTSKDIKEGVEAFYSE